MHNGYSDMEKVRFSNPASLFQPRGYSQIAEVLPGGRLILISGQVGLDRGGVLIRPNDFRAQLIQAFQNLQDALKAVGAKFRDVAKLNYYCVDEVSQDQLELVRQVRDQFVNVDAPPASTFVFVCRLARPEWLIEIEAMAVAPMESGSSDAPA
jgi:enamine deaminase RidA (YjgF/YER057c/UK114 family)